MNTKEFVTEAKAELARFTALLETSNAHLANYPNDNLEAKMIERYESVIKRCLRVINTLDK